MKGGPGSWTGPFQNKTGHSKTFMSILNNLFGHTNYTGSIGTDKTTIKRVQSKDGNYEFFHIRLSKFHSRILGDCLLSS